MGIYHQSRSQTKRGCPGTVPVAGSVTRGRHADITLLKLLIKFIEHLSFFLLNKRSSEPLENAPSPRLKTIYCEQMRLLGGAAGGGTSPLRK